MKKLIIAIMLVAFTFTVVYLRTPSRMTAKKGRSPLITKPTARRWTAPLVTKAHQPKSPSTKKRHMEILAKVATKKKAAPPSATIATRSNPRLQATFKSLPLREAFLFSEADNACDPICLKTLD